MRRRRLTRGSCLVLLLAASSAGALWPTASVAGDFSGHLNGHGAGGAPFTAGRNAAAWSAHRPSGNSFQSGSAYSGGSTSFYGGHHGRPPIGGIGYAPYYGTYAIGVPYSPYYYGPYGIPPLFVPADSMFGPGPLMQNIGNLAPADDGGGNANLPRGGGNGADPPAPKKPRVTNAASKVRAGKFLLAGDSQFVKQKFHQALERYREGALAAPDLADCFLRQAFAQVAMGQYEAASKAIQRGLQLKPDWAGSDFALAALYGADHNLTKLSHREGLAQAIEQNPLDAGLYLAMGAMLYFDGERDRARPFFERAARIGGNEDHLLDGFLAPMPADADKPDLGKAAAKPAGKVNL